MERKNKAISIRDLLRQQARLHKTPLLYDLLELPNTEDWPKGGLDITRESSTEEAQRLNANRYAPSWRQPHVNSVSRS